MSEAEETATYSSALAVEAVDRLLVGFRATGVASTNKTNVYIVSSATGEDVVVKFHAGDLRRLMGKERYVYGLLAGRQELPVPEVLGFDDSAIILSRCVGVELSSVIGDLPAVARADLASQLGQALRAMHSIHQPAFGYLLAGVIDPSATNDEYMTKAFESHLRTFQDFGGDPALAVGMEALVEGHAPLFASCDQAVVCHDDLHANNIFVVQHGRRWVLSGIIDVENARAADPLADVAKTGLYALVLNRMPSLPREPFLEAYGPLPAHAEELMRVYRMFFQLELWNGLARQGVVGFRCA